MNKPNCHECKWRGVLPGDSHIECRHHNISDSDRILTLSILSHTKQETPAMKRLNVSGDETGIRGGSFMWPISFDPIWLITCNGFEGENPVRGG